jgi:KUP system potassium uptake protein
MTGPATDRSMITTTHRSGTETGNSSGGRAARQNSGPDGVRREPPSSAGKPLHGAVLLAALGIVYGDIGTSPIYTFRECLKAGSDGEVVLGLLSLIFWSLTIVVTTKYVLFVMRADNHGEGGIMALLGLAAHSEPDLKRRSALILLLGIAGAALFYGDGMITPAISVLSAIEGLKVATPVLAPYVVPISLVVLLGLFLLQRSGSDRIGRYFGPVMGLWFLGLAISGLVQIIQSPSVLAALNPVHALSFLAQHGATGFVALGSVFLALDRSRSPLCRHGAFWARPNPRRLVRHCIACAGFELLRPGRVGARASGCG